MEQVSQLASLIEAAKEYHRQSCKILEELFGKLQKRWARQHSTGSAVHPVGGLQFYSVHIKATWQCWTMARLHPSSSGSLACSSNAKLHRCVDVYPAAKMMDRCKFLQILVEVVFLSQIMLFSLSGSPQPTFTQGRSSNQSPSEAPWMSLTTVRTIACLIAPP